MAIDMSGGTSPRISFSHDLHQSDGPESLIEDSDFDVDFDFCIKSSSGDASSTAEELFLDGKIRSLQLEDKFEYFSPIPQNPNGISNQDCLKESSARAKKIDVDDEEKKNHHLCKLIKRSSSLHCENSTSHKKSSFWSSLSRSNSTGSVLPKVVKENQNQNPKSKQVMKNSTSAESSTRKPPLIRKNYYNKGNGIMRISPVLNVSPPNISKKTANLLGLGTFFGSDTINKDKKIKK